MGTWADKPPEPPELPFGQLPAWPIMPPELVKQALEECEREDPEHHGIVLPVAVCQS